MESRTRIGVRPVVPEVMWYRMARSGGAARMAPNGGCSSWAAIHSSLVRKGARRRSSSEAIESAVTPAARKRAACHGTRASVHWINRWSLRTWSASSWSRGIVSWRGFQYGESVIRPPSALRVRSPAGGPIVATGARPVVYACRVLRPDGADPRAAALGGPSTARGARSTGLGGPSRRAGAGQPPAGPGAGRPRIAAPALPQARRWHRRRRGLRDGALRAAGVAGPRVDGGRDGAGPPRPGGVSDPPGRLAGAGRAVDPAGGQGRGRRGLRPDRARARFRRRRAGARRRARRR